MKIVQHGKRATWRKCNIKQVQYLISAAWKECNIEIAIHEECNTRKAQYEKNAKWREFAQKSATRKKWTWMQHRNQKGRQRKLGVTIAGWAWGFGEGLSPCPPVQKDWIEFCFYMQCFCSANLGLPLIKHIFSLAVDQVQFVIFKLRKVPWNWIAFYSIFFVSTGLMRGRFKN